MYLIRIRTDGVAFSDDGQSASGELGRILADLALEATYKAINGPCDIRDINGNVCGSIEEVPDEVPADAQHPERALAISILEQLQDMGVMNKGAKGVRWFTCEDTVTELIHAFLKGGK